MSGLFFFKVALLYSSVKGVSTWRLLAFAVTSTALQRTPLPCTHDCARTYVCCTFFLADGRLVKRHVPMLLWSLYGVCLHRPQDPKGILLAFSFKRFCFKLAHFVYTVNGTCLYSSTIIIRMDIPGIDLLHIGTAAVLFFF